MKSTLRIFLPVCALVFLALSVPAQRRPDDGKRSEDSLAATMLKDSGKAAVIVVGSAGKVAWATTKFTAKAVAKPVAKAIFVSAPPKLGMFALKQSQPMLKKALPLAVKLSVL